MNNIIKIITCLVLITACKEIGTVKEGTSSNESTALYLPTVKTEDTEFDTLSMVFHIALGDLVGNMRLRGEKEDQKTVLYAGLDYQGAWTRDASISVWFGLPFISPEVSKNTLLGVLVKNERGEYDHIGGQYWDKMIWLTGAWQYYLITGDEPFLKMAYQVSKKTLIELSENEYDPATGLFRGPAVYGDGISAYEDVYTNTGDFDGQLWLSNIDKWAVANPQLKTKKGEGMPMQTLSTNAVYYNAYQILSKMSAELHLNSEDNYQEAAKKLERSIQTSLWSDSLGSYKYYIDPFGGSKKQESLGLAFALLFDIPNDAQSNKIFKNTYVSPFGIPCVWPNFTRYTNAKNDMGRHAGTVWTHVQGFWCIAAAKNNKLDIMYNELKTQTDQAYKSKQFKEIYHPITGQEYGGLQEDGFVKDSIRLWKSTDRQTWGAAAYMGSVLYGLFGLEPTLEGLLIEPKVFQSYPNLRLEHLKYRNSIVQITIKGKGSQIASFKINGKSQEKNLIPAKSVGFQKVEISLK